MTYQPPVRDHAFILRDVLNIDQHGDLPGFSDAPFDVVEQILDAAESLFADRGYFGVSVREITDAASTRLAAVNYHFGTKEPRTYG